MAQLSLQVACYFFKLRKIFLTDVDDPAAFPFVVFAEEALALPPLVIARARTSLSMLLLIAFSPARYSNSDRFVSFAFFGASG